MRRVRNLQGKPGDPVEETAQQILEQEAQFVLRYATCPVCSAKNPVGLEASRADRKSTLLFGLVFLGGLAVAAAFYPWIALIFPVLNLVIIRPLALVNARKMRDKPFPTGMFTLSILLDITTIVVVLEIPRLAPIVPLLGIVQSLFGGSAKDQWKWDDAGKKLRFKTNEASAT